MNTLRSIFRSYYKFKYNTLLNLIGLTLGLACSMVLFLYVGFELSFDQFHADKNRIFRINEHSTSPSKKEIYPAVRIPVGPDMKDAFPQIEDFVRLKVRYQSRLLTHGEKSIQVKQSLYSDANFFQFFSFGLKEGDPSNVLTAPNSIVLTEEIAHKLFGENDPIGSVITCNDNSFVVSGIVNSIPSNSHICFDVLFPIEPLIYTPNAYISWDGGMSVSTFIKLYNINQMDELVAGLPNFLWKKINEKDDGSGFFTEFELEPLTSIHLHSHVEWDIFKKQSYTNVLILSGIAFLVLLIAVANYYFISRGINVLRVKDFGIKQYLGIGRYGLAKLLLFETVILFFTAALIAITFILIFYSGIEHLFETEFILKQLPQSLHYFIASVLLISITIGLILFTVYNRNNRTQQRIRFSSSSFRNRKVVYVSAFQFCMSIVLIASILFVYKQMKFALNKDLGFNTDNIINVSDEAIGTRNEALISEILRLPGVADVSTSLGTPGLETTQNGYKPQGSDQYQMFNALHVDDHFFNTFRIKLLKGRNFMAGKGIDNNSYIINETLAKQLGWDDPIGMNIYRNGMHEIVGVIKDFQVSSIYEKIPPLILSKEFQSDFYSLSINLRAENISGTLKSIEHIWNEVMPGKPFNYVFLDKRINSMYDDVQKTINMLLIFTFMSIMISVLGLFGITFLLINSRVKEIGIRKINGAKISEVLVLLNKDFIISVSVAFIIATPIVYYVMSKWLVNFAYKTELSWWIFVLAGILALGIAVLTVSWQSWKAATRNPVEALRYE